MEGERPTQLVEDRKNRDPNLGARQGRTLQGVPYNDKNVRKLGKIATTQQPKHQWNGGRKNTELAKDDNKPNPNLGARRGSVGLQPEP